VEEYRSGNVAAVVVLSRGRSDARHFERSIDNPNMLIMEVPGEPVGIHERLGTSVRHRPLLPHSAKARFTRRFCLPLFSIFVTVIGPISVTLRICVPPQGWRSIPAISIRRTRPVPLGGFTDIVRTSSGAAASS